MKLSALGSLFILPTQSSFIFIYQAAYYLLRLTPANLRHSASTAALRCSMSIYRINKDKDNPYVIVNKAFLSDINLSWQAKGILAYLLSLPDDWKIYEAELTTHSKDGLKRTRTCIKELIDKGYIKRQISKDEKGRFKGYEYSVYEVSSIMPKTENGKGHTTNNNITNIITGKGLERIKSRYFYNGKRISKEEYQVYCLAVIGGIKDAK